MSIPAQAVDSEYCLQGYVGGIEQTFPLKSGENRVGSLADNEIVLPRRGVSRHHARLVLEGRELQVEDLGSKNGTFVDGRRVGEATTAPGGAIRFGPVELRFQEFHRDDAELAIAFEPAITDQTSVIPVVESALGAVAGALGRRWLRLAEAFHGRLFSKREGDIGAALQLLQEELHLRSACVLEVPEDRPAVVLAAGGHLDRSATEELQRRVTSLLTSGPRQDIHFHTDIEGENTVAVLLSPGMDPLALALWGEYPGRIESETLLRLLARMLEPCRPRPELASGENRLTRFPGLRVPPDYVYAQSAAMRKIYELMQTLAQGDLPILVVGETGVGKEYLAHILHDSSPRCRGPFVAINCAAIPAELLEAELFGIGERVATGVAGSKGRLQLADGGTLFLDEIADMSADLQAKLLRALQEKEVHPVGRDPISVDVRVVAATNQDLKQRIQEGSFRADLYYRLAGYVLEIPPLRQRPEDIPALVERFLRDCAKELERPIRGLTVRALRLLSEYSWAGNVRELANEVRRAVYLCPDHGTIESSTLSQHIREFRPAEGWEPGLRGSGLRGSGHPNAGGPATRTSDGGATASGGSVTRPPGVRPPGHRTPDQARTPPKFRLDEEDESQKFPAPMGLGLDSLNLEHLEAQAVEEALRRCRQNQVQAAKLLGISRQSLRRRMERMGRLRSGDG